MTVCTLHRSFWYYYTCIKLKKTNAYFCNAGVMCIPTWLVFLLTIETRAPRYVIIGSPRSKNYASEIS